MKIAILGATSQIAKDLILSFSKNKSYDFALFGRNVELLDNNYQTYAYADFNHQQKYDVIINFVGISDPEKAQKMGNNILKITKCYDAMALDYIKCHQQTKYIFLSSGAVYGGNYQQPVDENSTVAIDNLSATNWYAISKLQTEIKHRALSELSIVDIRVFNYFSHTQDINARFLITDIARAIKNQGVFKTSADNIIRDFITPPDFYNLIQAIIDFEPINTALDCYSKSPISKFDLLSALQAKFKLQYEVDKNVNIVNATGAKINYYSTNYRAKNIGYKPNNTSLNGIIQQMHLI